ncbi:MAG: multidrug transporter MdfA, partial [Acinetobacter sp.]
MMFTFFFVIELVRVLYEHFHLWAYALSCLTLIVLWFTFPRATLKKIMLGRKERGEF